MNQRKLSPNTFWVILTLLVISFSVAYVKYMINKDFIVFLDDEGEVFVEYITLEQ